MRFLLCMAVFGTSAAHAEPSRPALVDTPVLVRVIERGAPLATVDFELKPASPNAARGALLPSQAAGKEAARRLMAGTAVRQSDLVSPAIVRRGDAVMLIIRAGALSVTTSGRALSGGGIGDPVRVVNLETSRALSAIVEARGRVRIMTSGEGQ